MWWVQFAMPRAMAWQSVRMRTHALSRTDPRARDHVTLITKIDRPGLHVATTCACAK